MDIVERVVFGEVLDPDGEKGAGNRFTERDFPFPERLFDGTVGDAVFPGRGQVNAVLPFDQRGQEAVVQWKNFVKMQNDLK